MEYSYEKMRYGFFIHYVADLTCYMDGKPSQTINETADSFDVLSFADDLEDMGVDYLVFTVWHYRTRPLYPSTVMEKWRPGNCSERDLVGEIIDAVSAKGIRIMLYTHPRDGFDFSDEERVRTGWGLECENGKSDTPDPRNFEYKKWNDFILSLYEELMERYGGKIIGLFIDGMGPGRFVGGSVGSQSYEYPIIDYMKIRRIAKAANPDIALIQNFFGYYFTCDFGMSEGFYGYENKYTATHTWPACDKALAMARFNEWWANSAKGPNVARVTPGDAVRFTVFQSTCSTAGGIAWAAGPYCGGGWEYGVMETMKIVGRHIKKLGEAVRNVVPSTSWPTVSGDTLESKGWMAAAASRDRAYEYIHIMKKPEGGIIRLTAPQDGASFSEPVILSCNAVVTEFIQNETGLYFHIEGEWDDLDTVIRLVRNNNPDAFVIEWRNDTDIRIIYTGEWIYDYLSEYDSGGKYKFHGNYEYDAHMTKRDGDWWCTVFEGDKVEVVGPVAPDGGSADVLIDNIKQGEIDNIAPQRKNRQILFTSGLLYSGLHTIKVIKTGGKTIEFDAVRITRHCLF